MVHKKSSMFENGIPNASKRQGGASQGTCIKDPWAKTTRREGLNMGSGRWVGQRRGMGWEDGNNCN